MIPDTDIVIIGGSPGIGKTTLVHKLQRVWDNCPAMEFSNIRSAHLDPEWKLATEQEEDMSFEMLQAIISIYLQHKKRPVIVTDLQDERLAKLEASFKSLNYMIFTLYSLEDEDVAQRIIDRKSGFNDIEAAIEWNRKIQSRASYKNERKIDITKLRPDKVFEKIILELNTKN